MSHRNEKGASLVEASILLPLLILMAIGLSEIGFLVVDYLTVTNSAREGARTGAAAADFHVPPQERRRRSDPGRGRRVVLQP